MKRSILVVALATLLATLGPASGSAQTAEWWEDRGGDADLPPTVLWDGDAGVSNIKDQAIVRMSKYGFVYIAGQQHSRLRVRHNERWNTIVYRDRGTDRVKRLHRRCRDRAVSPGIKVVCRIPPRFAESMFVQVWPRLGNDVIDTRGLPARFRTWVLADAGHDTVRTSDGDDFVNAAKGRDVVESGDGDDWLRGGRWADTMDGGAGNDKLVGDGGPDRLVGGDGEDALYGGSGHDELDGGPGEDQLVPSPGQRVPDDDL